MKKIYYMMLMAMMSVAMVSCDDWDWDSPYYVDDIVGSWESYYGCDGYYEYDILGYDVVRYDFYANHTGRYTYYSSYYGLDYVDFDWDTWYCLLIANSTVTRFIVPQACTGNSSPIKLKQMA